MNPNSTMIFSLFPCIISEKSENVMYAEMNMMEVIQSECNTCYLFHWHIIYNNNKWACIVLLLGKALSNVLNSKIVCYYFKLCLCLSIVVGKQVSLE